MMSCIKKTKHFSAVDLTNLMKYFWMNRLFIYNAEFNFVQNFHELKEHAVRVCSSTYNTTIALNTECYVQLIKLFSI